MSVAIETESEFTRAGLIASATLCPDTGQAGPWNFVTPFSWLVRASAVRADACAGPPVRSAQLIWINRQASLAATLAQPSTIMRFGGEGQAQAERGFYAWPAFATRFLISQWSCG